MLASAPCAPPATTPNRGERWDSASSTTSRSPPSWRSASSGPRVLVFDWDVHHGNGTAEAFRRRADVLFVSIHQAGIFPGSGPSGDFGSGPGEGYTVNLPVPAGAEEELWLSLLEHIVIPVAVSFDPDLVLVSAGFDAHRADPLADGNLEARSFAQMACQVRDMAAQVGARPQPGDRDR
jgi:acetoin utilization deacetylase AcuC-like enzyme